MHHVGAKLLHGGPHRARHPWIPGGRQPPFYHPPETLSANLIAVAGHRGNIVAPRDQERALSLECLVFSGRGGGAVEIVDQQYSHQAIPRHR